MPKDVKDDVKAMLDSLENPSVEEPRTEPPATEPPAPATEPPAPVTEEPQDEGYLYTDEPETDAPTTREPVDDDKFSELMRKNQELEEKLKALEKEDKGPKTEPPSTDPPIGDVDFSSELDLDDLSNDPAALNKVLNSVYKRAVETVRGEYKELGKKTFEAIPQEVDRTLTTKQTLQELTTNFYKENDDLKPWAKTVGVVFDELIAQNPDADYKETLNKVAEVTRERIGLKDKPKRKSNQRNNDGDPPPLHRKKGKRVRPKPKETGTLRSEIDEMNESLNL